LRFVIEGGAICSYFRIFFFFGRLPGKPGGGNPSAAGPERHLRTQDTPEVPEAFSVVQRPDNLDVLIWDDEPGMY
jgi:hypothetical protein